MGYISRDIPVVRHDLYPPQLGYIVGELIKSASQLIVYIPSQVFCDCDCDCASVVLLCQGSSDYRGLFPNRCSSVKCH